MPKNIWLIVIGMVINITGASFLWPLNAIYLHDHLGKSLTVAGFVLMINSLATVIGNLLGGVLFDKIGGFRSILTGAVITLFAGIGLVFYNGWPHYVFWLMMIGFGSGIIFPSMYAMAGTVWKEGRRRAFNAVYIATNLGVALGSALGGFIASFSFAYIFIANMFMYVLFFLLILFSYRGITVSTAPTKSVLADVQYEKNNRKIYALLALCVGYLLCWIGYVQWTSTISSYTQEIGVSLREYSLLWTMNGALIVLGQPFVNRFVYKFIKQMKLQLIVGMLIFIASFVVAAYASNFIGFLTAMLILTLGEMFVWPAVPTIAGELAPVGREGFYQGVVNSTATVGKMVGPLLGGFLVDHYGMKMMFMLLLILYIFAIGTTFLYDKIISGTKQEANQEASHYS